MVKSVGIRSKEVTKKKIMSEQKTQHSENISALLEQSLESMIEYAKQAYHNAHAPYSNFHVGAASLSKTGKIYPGCNVENASYGLTVCAERNSISHAVINGDKQLIAIVIYTEEERLTPPCGACRQVICEFMPQDASVIATNHLGQKKTWTVQQLLPDAFTPEFLA